MTNPTAPEIPDGLEKRLREWECPNCNYSGSMIIDQAADALAKARVALEMLEDQRREAWHVCDHCGTLDHTEDDCPIGIALGATQ